MCEFSVTGSYGKTELKDGCLPTLTTNCRCLVSTQHGRPMCEEELLLNAGIPVVERAADAAGIPQTKLKDVSRQAQSFMAGNRMHVPSVRAVLLLAMLFVNKK